ncbi:MAG TPA: hypothetical protein VGM88_11550 [Kofleriaceae bacterium]|jgi:hypothetical protein
MKPLRYLMMIFALAVPATALATSGGSDAPACCANGGSSCCHLGCPYCHHAR